jgi:Patatin-like phospholipase
VYFVLCTEHVHPVAVLRLCTLYKYSVADAKNCPASRRQRASPSQTSQLAIDRTATDFREFVLDMPGRELCLLSLDGGGIRGLSSLQILKQLMEAIGREAGLASAPKPCETFDMIGGTSTGG